MIPFEKPPATACRFVSIRSERQPFFELYFFVHAMNTTRTVTARHSRTSAAVRPGDAEGFTLLDGVEMYRIPDYDSLRPFMMTLSSPSDHWMYVSSFGGLTAGRRDASHALFPYETEDRLHHAHGTTGSATQMRVWTDENQIYLWEPFNHRARRGQVRRNLYKTVLCDRIVFEEINPELGLTFRYQWAASKRFGFVRTATLLNDRAARAAKIEILDGLLNLLPACLPLILQQTSSCLADAYKCCEVDGDSGLAMISLSSIVTDRPEPAEALRATTIWSRGLPEKKLFFDEQAMADFREDRQIAKTPVISTGHRAAFLIGSSFTLPPGLQIQWDIVADVNQDHSAIEQLRKQLTAHRPPAATETVAEKQLSQDAQIRRAVLDDVQETHLQLTRYTAAADAPQSTADRPACAYHAACVLFNNLRGGVPVDQYNVAAADFQNFLSERNYKVTIESGEFLRALPARIPLPLLLSKIRQSDNDDLLRLAYEYLPLTLSRRHGDPTRPWNQFSIKSQNPDGSPAIHYEGNWRDIFQNWEALAVSFPEFLESFIAKFVNASTMDGFNPYRITSAGIDWEIHDPANPWSNIGYWGDHQIIYLLKFLEASEQHHPSSLPRMLTKEIFSYANVPYRLNTYEQMLADPRQTIAFDHHLENVIDQRVAQIGADGKLVLDSSGNVYHANLLEKLLVPMLGKVCNLVLSGGIWMNTQRPEWNDANNALAGTGLSMVTLCHLRRYTQFLLDLLRPLADQPVRISREILDWLNETGAALLKHSDLLRLEKPDDASRRRLLDDLGHSFSAYRRKIYDCGFTGKLDCPIAEILPMLRLAISYMDYSIAANRRPDGLFHSYNILQISHGGASVDHLQLMLEGQVAALSSATLDPDQAAELLETLLQSPLYRACEKSFMLYPDSPPTSFLNKNQLSPAAVKSVPLLNALVQSADQSIINLDSNGNPHFNADLTNQRDLSAALDKLGQDPSWRDLVCASKRSLLELYDQLFQHQTFTGRSGSMRAYEGIGSVYWHMVGKLLVAAQECFWHAEQQPAARQELALLYYRLRDGLGFNQPAHAFGAFPTDPHSHTPAAGGARQPGMTGQVKEEILRRFGELGVRVQDGQVHFRPLLLRRREFLTAPSALHYNTLGNEQKTIPLKPGELVFTYCQVPIVYHLVESPIQIRLVGRETITLDGDAMNSELSRKLFSRSGDFDRIDVNVPATMIQLK